MSKAQQIITVSHEIGPCKLLFMAAGSGAAVKTWVETSVSHGKIGRGIVGPFDPALMAEWVDQNVSAKHRALAYSALSQFEDVVRILALRGSK